MDYQHVTPVEPLEPRTLFSAPAENATTVTREVEYMQFTIDHHSMGVRMAELGEAKSANRFLRRMSSRMAQDQAREVAQLQQYLRDWYDVEYTPQSTRADRVMLRRLASEEGAAFDVDYSRTFAMHHATIIERSQADIPRFEHRVLKDFADHIIPEQGDEIVAFDAFLHAYGQKRHLANPAS